MLMGVRNERTAALRLPQEWKEEFRRLPWLLLIPLGTAMPSIISLFPNAVEQVYSRGVYPLIAGTIGFLTGLLPFSIAEWLLYTLIIGLPVLLLVTLIRALLRKIRWVKFFRLIVTILILFGIALNVFHILWGFNYSRNTLAQQLSLDVHERSLDELEELCFKLASDAIPLRAQVPEDSHGVFCLPNGVADCFKRIPNAYGQLEQQIPQFVGRAARPKYVLGAQGMSWAGISGIYIPFTVEPNVNTHQPALLIPSSAAHESAHSLGIAREDEANFAAYLACLSSNDPVLQYSGVMLALIHCGNELYRARHAAYKELYDTYSQGMLRDLADYDAYWDRYEGPVEEAVNNVNDGYLKYNGQEEGVKSYGEMVDLLLAWYAK